MPAEYASIMSPVKFDKTIIYFFHKIKKNFFRKYKSTFTKTIMTGTPISRPMTAAKAASESTYVHIEKNLKNHVKIDQNCSLFDINILQVVPALILH